MSSAEKIKFLRNFFDLNRIYHNHLDEILNKICGKKIDNEIFNGEGIRFFKNGFFLEMKPQYKKKTKPSRIDLHSKTYGVTKKEYEMLDDIDLLIEVGFLIQCEAVDRCGTCRKLLRFCLKILINRLDEIRFINFFDAIEMVKNCKSFFKMVDILEHRRLNRTLVKNFLREYKLKNNADELINSDNYNFLLKYSIRH